jgi:hypothetical protein
MDEQVLPADRGVPLSYPRAGRLRDLDGGRFRGTSGLDVILIRGRVFDRFEPRRYLRRLADLLKKGQQFGFV